MSDVSREDSPDMLAEKCYMLISEYQTRMAILRQEPDPEEVLGLIASSIRTGIEAAAAKVRRAGERVVWKNETGIHQPAIVGIVGVGSIKPREELVIRPIGGKEQKSE